MSELYELIKRFPENEPVSLIVYDETHIAEAAYEVALHWGGEYLDEYVTFVTYKDNESYKPSGHVYIDPCVLKYKAQWEN